MHFIRWPKIIYRLVIFTHPERTASAKIVEDVKLYVKEQYRWSVRSVQLVDLEQTIFRAMHFDQNWEIGSGICFDTLYCIHFCNKFYICQEIYTFLEVLKEIAYCEIKSLQDSL